MPGYEIDRVQYLVLCWDDQLKSLLAIFITNENEDITQFRVLYFLFDSRLPTSPKTSFWRGPSSLLMIVEGNFLTASI